MPFTTGSSKQETIVENNHDDTTKNGHPKDTWYFPLVISLFIMRILSALLNPISDCDETFNYWEPTSFVMYGKGMKTWEYSPEFALRSYVYIQFHAIIGVFFDIFRISRIGTFYGIRLVLSMISAYCELKFANAVRHRFGANMATYTLGFLAFSSGMFNASSAYLPSSMAMYTVTLSYSAWMEFKYARAVFWMGVTGLVAWPFALVLGGFMAVDVLANFGLWKTVRAGVLTAAVCLLTSVAVDWYYYRKFVVAVLNIFVYNSNTTGEIGQNLYGVEPWTFFFANLFLNFNIAFLLALVSPPIALVSLILLRSYRHFVWTFLKISAMSYVAFAFFSWMPHKEERFLFILYPLLCMAAAFSVHEVEKLVSYLAFGSIKPKSKPQTLFQKLVVKSVYFTKCVLFLVFLGLSISRTFSVVKNYHAPLAIYSDLASDIHQNTNKPSPNCQISVCVGKEWYRFPSHFFLPDQPCRTKLQFLKSDFSGQLPKHFEDTPDATSRIPSDMNDINREEMSRYVEIKSCDYIIDLDLSHQNEPHYGELSEFEVVSERNFLNAAESPSMTRAFYIPVLSEKKNVFSKYQLLKRKK
eukprot:961987_1